MAWLEQAVLCEHAACCQIGLQHQWNKLHTHTHPCMTFTRLECLHGPICIGCIYQPPCRALAWLYSKQTKWMTGKQHDTHCTLSKLKPEPNLNPCTYTPATDVCTSPLPARARARLGTLQTGLSSQRRSPQSLQQCNSAPAPAPPVSACPVDAITCNSAPATARTH